ncbi:hypothetical protein TRIP_E290016 [uncultured Spirochaetota bacterium]|nr:hypothetical protein TRIP_E290016 [uncultured Spirochaetota bacterium]
MAGLPRQARTPRQIDCHKEWNSVLEYIETKLRPFGIPFLRPRDVGLERIVGRTSAEDRRLRLPRCRDFPRKGGRDPEIRGHGGQWGNQRSIG